MTMAAKARRPEHISPTYDGVPAYTRRYLHVMDAFFAVSIAAASHRLTARLQSLYNSVP